MHSRGSRFGGSQQPDDTSTLLEEMAGAETLRARVQRAGFFASRRRGLAGLAHAPTAPTVRQFVVPEAEADDFAVSGGHKSIGRAQLSGDAVIRRQRHQQMQARKLASADGELTRRRAAKDTRAAPALMSFDGAFEATHKPPEFAETLSGYTREYAFGKERPSKLALAQTRPHDYGGWKNHFPTPGMRDTVGAACEVGRTRGDLRY